MLPHVVPFDEARVPTDQPWLTPAELEFAECTQVEMDEHVGELDDDLESVPL